jgi:hypothetical protein
MHGRLQRALKIIGALDRIQNRRRNRGRAKGKRMSEQSQSRGRYAEQQFRSGPPRIPRVPIYQARGQLLLTVLAMVVIYVVLFVWWILS